MDALEFFGNETQRKIQERNYRLWPYLKSHPRLSFVGRAIGIDAPRLDEVEQIVGLTMELGFLALGFVKPNVVGKLRSALENHGLIVEMWQHLTSNKQTKLSCQSVVASIHLPADYKIMRISAETSPDQLLKFQTLMQSCGVAPLPGYIMRGQSIPVVAEMILNADAEVVATGVSIFRHNPEGILGKTAHVGFLATEPGQRGQGFARLLLARIILASFEEMAAEMVYTGVRPDNVPSQRVCRICGLEKSGMYMLGAIAPQMGQGEFTR